ncbi:MAG: hypothetical protein HFJ04_02590 [Lachnospiraceae bacterium]|nr:hypothetical protein [Lachnospiraceae bacterium]
MTELKVKVQKGILKRAAALAMSVCLGMTMLPTAALAADDQTVKSISITADKTTLTAAGAVAKLTAELEYDAEKPSNPSENPGPDNPSKNPDPDNPENPSKNPDPDNPDNPENPSKNPNPDNPSKNPDPDNPENPSKNPNPDNPSKNPDPENPSKNPDPENPSKNPSENPSVNPTKKPTEGAESVEFTGVDNQVTWTIKSGSEFVTLTSNGTTATVTAKSVTYGQAVIVAEAGGKEAQITITVNIANQGKPDDEQPVKVDKVTLNKTTLSFNTIGATETLTATVAPANAKNKTVTWKSSNEKVATVAGGKVTAVGNGTAEITATADGKSAKATVTVSQKTTKVAITLNGQAVKGKTLKSSFNKKYTLKAVVSPTNADAKNAEVKWSTSNKKIATVNSKGKVTIKKAKGTVTITAKTADGQKASVKFKVSKAKVKVSKIKVVGSKTMKTSGKKKKQTLKVAITPATADNQKVTWKSSNTKIATVNSKGKVTAKKKGKVTITATAKDGSKKKAKFKITVK